MLRLERVAIISIWMLDLDLPSLIEELSQKGFITARVKAEYDTYSISFLEPEVIASKGLIRLCYGFGRRSLTVEGPKANEVFSIFKEVESVLENKGINPSKGVLAYDLQVRAKVEALKLPLIEVDTEDVMGFKIFGFPSIFVMKEGDPNTTKWFNLALRPVWSTWGSEEKRIFDLALVYRDSKERLLQFIENLEENLSQLLKMIIKGR